jgi:cytoskeletal protein RodZ
MDDSSFGTRLRQQREQRGFSLEGVSAATRISVRMLEAFENEQWDRLPGGIFNRGFLRSIARFLKIDENALIAAYVSATNDSPDRRAMPAEAPSRPLHILWISAAVLLLAAALAAGGYLAYNRSHSRAHQNSYAHPAPSSATMATPRH